MMVFVSEPSKAMFITEVRTGSSNLTRLSEFGVLEFLGREYDNNLGLENLCDLIKTKYHDYKIYLCIRDPQIRRESALSMIISGGQGTSFTEDVASLRAMVGEALKRSAYDKKYGFINYTLNDNHVDWGTSCYYHILVTKGIIPTLLHLDNKSIFEMPSFIGYHSWQNVLKTEERDYHMVLKNIIQTYHSDNVQAQQLWQRAEAQVSWTGERIADVPVRGPNINVKPWALARTAVYQYYYNMFYCNCIMSDGLNAMCLPFQTWIDMEAKMYYLAMKFPPDQAPHASKVILDRTLKTYAECYDFQAIAEAHHNSEYQSLPGGKFLRLFSVYDLENSLTNT